MTLRLSGFEVSMKYSFPKKVMLTLVRVGGLGDDSMGGSEWSMKGVSIGSGGGLSLLLLLRFRMVWAPQAPVISGAGRCLFGHRVDCYKSLLSISIIWPTL